MLYLIVLICSIFCMAKLALEHQNTCTVTSFLQIIGHIIIFSFNLNNHLNEICIYPIGYEFTNLDEKNNLIKYVLNKRVNNNNMKVKYTQVKC